METKFVMYDLGPDELRAVSGGRRRGNPAENAKKQADAAKKIGDAAGKLGGGRGNCHKTGC